MALIQQDLIPGSGDQLLTFDSETNLEWLNLTATANRSYVEVPAGFGGVIGTYGFRYATPVEGGDLLTHLDIALTGFAGIPGNVVPIETFIGFMNGKSPTIQSSDQSTIIQVRAMYKARGTPIPPPGADITGAWLILE